MSRGSQRLRIGITGNIGSGKSSLTGMLAARGAATVDADACARLVVATDEALQQSLAASFGADLLDDNGQIRRQLLAERAFADEASSRQLDGLIRKPLERAIWSAVETAAAEHDLVVLDAPLLFEWGIQDHFDLVIVVISSPATATARLQQRGLSMEQIERRRARQWPADRQVAAADIVIDNDGSLSELAVHAQVLWDRLCEGQQSSDQKVRIRASDIDKGDTISE